MPTTLLPASAAAFAPRAAPTVVLNSKVEPWLTATLKRTNRVKRPLNSAPQHKRCLTETLSSSSAIWTLCSLMLSKAPETELRKDDNPLVEALFNYQLIHMEAYVVHVDLVYQNEVAFKLTPESIELLVEYHKDIYSVDCAAKLWDWSEKESQVKKLHDEFVQAANRFVFRANAHALEGLEEDGAGELLSGKSEDVKNAIMALFVPLLPPPPQPRAVEVPPPASYLPSSPGPNLWWSQSTLPSSHSAPVDPWKLVPSSPSATSSDSHSSMWANMGVSESQLSSPTTSYSQPYCSASSYYGAAQTMAPIPQLPLPSTLAMSCGPSAGFGGFGGAFGGMSGYGGFGGGFGGFGGFGWDRYQEYTTTM